MNRPRVIDTFPFHDELDVLECRLTELEAAVDVFVLVEADVNHQDRPKPYYYAEHAARFARWAEQIVHVRATDLPPAADFPDPWTREQAQREWISEGLARIGVDSRDVILQSDVDEIPRALHARNVRPLGLLSFEQRLHCFAVDWLHPEPWRGTVAGTAGFVKGLGPTPFATMRDARNIAECPDYLRDAGWHLSWLGGTEAARRKLTYFCHTEITDHVLAGLTDDHFYREGFHVDGKRMRPVDVDRTWPKWIREGKAPASWFRPR